MTRVMAKRRAEIERIVAADASRKGFSLTYHELAFSASLTGPGNRSALQDGLRLALHEAGIRDRQLVVALEITTPPASQRNERFVAQYVLDELERILESKAITSVFQPIVEIETG
jgi:hypothetical protein